MTSVWPHGAVLMKTFDNAPVHRTAWMRAEPVPASLGERTMLAPGVWIVRQAQWWPVSVFDSAEQLPWDYDAVPVKRTLPFPAWHSYARCNDVPDSDQLFFGIDDDSRPSLPPRMFRTARRICSQCPVQVECLSQALSEPEEFGIWACTTGRQRRKLQLRLEAGETIPQVVSAVLRLVVP